jgi:hypothetical protein
MPFTKTKDFPSHGYPDSTPDMTGGPGFAGVHELGEFVKQGGVLVALDNSAAIVADLGISSVLSSHQPAKLFHPGSLVTAKARQASSPILYGYPEKFHLYKGNTPLLRSALRDRSYMVAQFGDEPLADEKPYDGEIMGVPADEQPQNKKHPKKNPVNTCVRVWCATKTKSLGTVPSLTCPWAKVGWFHSPLTP